MNDHPTLSNNRWGSRAPAHNNTLFHLLRDERIRRGQTQLILAEKIGISPRDLHRYENRHHLPNSDTFVAWLEVLGFTISPPV